MPSMYNLKRQIAAYHENSKAGSFRIHMGGKTIKRGEPAKMIDLLPDEAKERLFNNITKNGLKPNKKPEFLKTRKEKELKEKETEKPKEKKTEAKPKETKYTAKQLELLSFGVLRKLGEKFGVKGRSKKELIKDILEAQGK